MTKKLRELKQVIQDGALSRRAQCFITGKYQCCTLKNSTLGTSLAGQWLRLHFSFQRARVQSRLGELRSQRVGDAAKKKNREWELRGQSRVSTTV